MPSLKRHLAAKIVSRLIKISVNLSRKRSKREKLSLTLTNENGITFAPKSGTGAALKSSGIAETSCRRMQRQD